MNDSELLQAMRDAGIHPAVVDPFGGSGTTLIACEQLDRTCYMLEISPVYCDVILRRWETLTGQAATRLSQQESTF
jgi:DNA modification methylase